MGLGGVRGPGPRREWARPQLPLVLVPVVDQEEVQRVEVRGPDVVVEAPPAEEPEGGGPAEAPAGPRGRRRGRGRRADADAPDAVPLPPREPGRVVAAAQRDEVVPIRSASAPALPAPPARRPWGERTGAVAAAAGGPDRDGPRGGASAERVPRSRPQAPRPKPLALG